MQGTTVPNSQEFTNIMEEISNNRARQLDYDASLKDSTYILFYRLPRDENEKQIFLDEDNNNKEFHKVCPLDDEINDIILIADNKMYVNKVDITMLLDPDFADKILDTDKIVYPYSRMSITFDQPCMDTLKFNVHGNIINGFTMHHLILQVLRHYRFVYKSHLHFDLESGEWNNEKIENNGLLHNSVGSYWYDVNIIGLKYQKKTNSWIVLYDQYC
jgi:hypothetical protein